MSSSKQALFLVALVAGGIATYHFLVADTAGSATVVTEMAQDNGDLERRITALERREPMLQGSVDVSGLRGRMRDLESRVAILEESGRALADGEAPATAPAQSTSTTEVADGAVDEAAPGGALKKRVESLVEGAMRSRMQDRMRGRLDRSLDELGIDLTADQREKLEAAMAERMESMREIRHAGRESGSSREDMDEQIAGVSARFTETLTTFMPAADAQALTTATAFGPGFGPGPGGGGRGPGR